MKKIKFFFPVLILLFIVIFASCEKEEAEVKINESEVLVQYLESAQSPLKKDFVNTDMPTIIGASEVKTLMATNRVYIIDIRSAADFALGHIANAKNVVFSDLLSHVKGLTMANYDKVAIVCYTGQTAGFGASLLRLMGYDKVYSLKWGMCSWNSFFAGKWNTAIAGGNAYASQMVKTDSPKAAKGELPVLNTGKSTGQEILEARVAALLTEGFTPASITNATVFGNISNYSIVNYWTVAHYGIGHISGAMQYTPKEAIKLAADLKTLPVGKSIAVYCYTGQTSAFLVAYLRLLGYDAKSILFGTNAMMYDTMVANSMTIFKASEIMGYDYVLN
jgi:rhodanese-related sulfurtransferase